MHLSDTDILSRLDNDDAFDITPIDDAQLQVQPASVDTRLANQFIRYTQVNTQSINPLLDDMDSHTDRTVLEDGDSYTLHPGDFVLGSTVEWVSIPNDIVGYVNGRSTMGRLAVVIHATAGLLDPGWEGNVTLEISNLGRVPIELTPGMRIAQLTFEELKSEATVPYGSERDSKYQAQDGVQSARVDHEGGIMSRTTPFQPTTD